MNQTSWIKECRPPNPAPLRFCLRCGVELVNLGPNRRYCPDCLPEVRGRRGAEIPAEARPRRRAVEEREGEFLRLVRIADWAGLSYGKFMAKSPETRAALIAAYDRHK